MTTLLVVKFFLNMPLGKFVMLILMLGFFGAVLYFTNRAKGGKNLYIREIAGISAINEAIGRATEMGRPVLYVPGIADVDDIQTIASVVILSGPTRPTKVRRSD